jgi:hypothetical protein
MSQIRLGLKVKWNRWYSLVEMSGTRVALEKLEFVAYHGDAKPEAYVHD